MAFEPIKRRLVQPSKAWSLMVKAPMPSIMTPESEVQPSNAEVPISDTLSGRETYSSFLQPSKA